MLPGRTKASVVASTTAAARTRIDAAQACRNPREVARIREQKGCTTAQELASGCKTLASGLVTNQDESKRQSTQDTIYRQMTYLLAPNSCSGLLNMAWVSPQHPLLSAVARPASRTPVSDVGWSSGRWPSDSVMDRKDSWN